MCDEKEIGEIIRDRFIPAIMQDLLLSDIITADSSKEEISEAILNFVNDEESMKKVQLAIVMGDEFELAIENEIHLGRNSVAISLAGICLEHITNEFYNQVLIDKYDFSKQEYDSCMKSVTIKGKMTWLYKLVTSECISNDIIEKVNKICSERNRIVHYKPVIEDLDKVMLEADNKIDVNSLLPLIEEVKKIFTETKDSLFETYKLASDLYNSKIKS